MGRGSQDQPDDGTSSGLETSIRLSLVIPAYNEAERLPATLRVVSTFLQSRGFTWEFIVADDGSQDATPEIAASVAASDDRVRLLRLPHRGKAATVRSGVELARGEHILFTDADLSTPVEHIEEALALLDSGWDLVIGTREGSGARRIGEPAYRHVMGRLFNLAVRLLAVPGVRDTQCGFKGFRGPVARDLFSRVLLYRDDGRPLSGPLVTGFDVELLFLARKRGYRLYELPVTWRHVDGSKVRPGVDSFLMLRDALQVRLNDLRGRYDGQLLSQSSVEPGRTDH